MTLRIGVAGTGRMAATMIGAMRLSPDAVPVAAASAASPERARHFAADRGLRAHDGLAGLLADPELDAIYVANATADHAATALAALEAGRPVLCEKPFAVSAEEGARVLDAARAAGVPFMEAMWAPLLPAWARFLELAAAEAAGRPRLLQMDFGYPADPSAHPRLFAGPGAGALLDRGIYCAALALRVFGPVRDVQAMVEAGPDGTDLEAIAQIAHEGGGRSRIACSLLSLAANEARLACEGGEIALEAPVIPGETVTLRRAAPAAGGDGGGGGLKARLRRSPALRRAKALLGGPERIRAPWGADPYLPLLARFAAQVRGGAVESPDLPHGLSLEALRLIDRIRAAAEEGGRAP